MVVGSAFLDLLVRRRGQVTVIPSYPCDLEGFREYSIVYAVGHVPRPCSASAMIATWPLVR